jgi:hypothetical protein
MPCYVLLNLIIPQLLLKCNDIEQNPGPTPAVTQTEFNFCHFNARSILSQDQVSKVSKYDELCAMAAANSFDLIGVSETWLDQSIDDSQLVVPGYSNPLRRDRSRQGGGVMVYLSESVPAKRRVDLELPNLEIVCVEVQTMNALVLFSIVCVLQAT